MLCVKRYFSFVLLKLSIIVPVYNVSKYLPCCIESVLNQSFSNFELLLIDDGSTDGSGAICDAYAQIDNRIRVFHKDNEGVSSARNLGLNHAVGEWVYFVDSDDEILPTGLQVLVDSISEDVDNVLVGYEKYSKDGQIVDAIEDRIVVTLSKEKSLLLLFSGHALYYPYLGYLWLWLFRRRIIQENKLRFETSIKIKEDTLFIVQYICRSNGKTRYNTTPVYKYKMREDSVMGELGIKYCPNYRSSLDAVIQMHHCIHQLPDIGKELSDAAKFEVVNRVYMIRGQMMKFKALDSSIVLLMKRQANKEVGLPYYLLYQYYRNRRRVSKLIKKVFHIN